MFSICVTLALNYQYIKKDPQRISKMKPYINKYDWSRIELPSHKKDWNNFEKILKQLILMYYLFHTILNKSEPHMYQNSNRKKQVILLMITDNNEK